MTRSHRHYTRFIPCEELGDVRTWEFGDVHGNEALRPLMAPERCEEAPLPDVPPGIAEAEHQALVQQAHDEGHARGLAEGREQAGLEWQQRMDDYVSGEGRAAAGRLAQVTQSLEDSLAGMQQSMAAELLQLACDIARQVVRQEVSASPQALLPVVREALAMLVGENRPATVRLSPADWAALEQPLREEHSSGRIAWQADAAVAPGDCIVESAGMVVDGTLDKRWRRAIAALGLTGGLKEDGCAD
ncbi:MAG: flagellar assembly protein FliH [Proteobacteria bacterium]|nr:flagellar assembly protein FliH [Pseudomonadota bacterium]